jgi:hypothetical protein
MKTATYPSDIPPPFRLPRSCTGYPASFVLGFHGYDCRDAAGYHFRPALTSADDTFY